MKRFQKFYIFVLSILFSLNVVHAESLRVSPEWLMSHLKDQNLVILDSRPIDNYKVDHIEGALSFPVSLTYQKKSNNGQIVETDVMQALMREKGISDDKVVVVYDAGQLVDAARLFWVLEVYGLSHVKVLSSGYDYWTKNNYPKTSAVPTIKPSQYVVSINHNRIASKFSTQLATKNPQHVVMDARSTDSYNGKISNATRFGHIPTAINVPVTNNIKKVDGIQSLLSIEELSKIYINLSKDKKVITYCNIGRISSANYLALRELGFDVSNYDASWLEWGNDLNLPIEK